MSGLPWYWLRETCRPPLAAPRAGRVKPGATVGVASADVDVPASPFGAPFSEPLATPMTAAATSRTAIAVPSLYLASSRAAWRTQSVTAVGLPLLLAGSRWSPALAGHRP